MKFLRNIRAWFRNIPFRYKVAGYLMVTICLTVFSIVCCTFFVTRNSIMKQAKEITMRQLEQNASLLSTFLSGLEDTSEGMVTDKNVQEYLETRDSNSNTYTAVVDNVYQTMSDIMSSKKEIMYVYIYKKADKKVLYLGPNTAGKNADFSQAARLLGGKRITGSPIRINFRRDPVATDKRSINIYQPILDIYEIKKPIGMLCISISEDVVSQFYLSKHDNLPLNTFIIDGSGKIVSDSDKSKIGHSAGLGGVLRKKDGSAVVHGKLAVFRYMSGWNWYVVGTLPESYLFRDSDSLLMVTVLIVLIILAMAILASLRFSRLLVRPLEELILRMSRVSKGDMATRIDLAHYGGNFRQVSDGFNIMVERIESLMKKIVEEQRQLKEIEFKALQAQINPHFLYNTLDTIHWQALVNGQEDISTMVKALAGFYRICLSRGQDVIPLKSELSHVMNYLIIQGYRYKEKLESFIDVPEELNSVQIPKMTLQPLVENSILHGMKGKTSKCFIKITGERSGNEILLHVIDNGVGMSARRLEELNRSLAQEGESVGYGVQNVHRRLSLILGRPYGLIYENNRFGGVTATVRLPG